MKELEPCDKNHEFHPINALIAQRLAEWENPWGSIDFYKRALEEREMKIIKELGRSPLATEFGDYTYIVFGDLTNGSHHEMLIFGKPENIKDNMLVRVHSSCRTNEVYHAINCECRKEIEQSMRLIQEEEAGAIIYMEQEGRGTGIAGKLAQLNGMFGWVDGHIEQKVDDKGERIDTDRAYKDAGYPSECRDFTASGQMLQQFGITSVRLITNNPIKISGVEKAGIKVTPTEIHITPDNEIIASDLKSKAKNLGHHIEDKHCVVGGIT